MTAREMNIFNMFVGTIQFDTANSNDYRDLPDAATYFTIVREAVAAFEEYAAAQTSGASGRAVERQSVLREAIRRKMKRYSRTARALNLDDAGFRRLFSIPNNDSYQLLLATAREFVEEGRRFTAEFRRKGIPAGLADELEDDIEALEAAINAKAGAHTEKVGAGAGIDAQIERGMEAEIQLDAIMHNVYFDDPVKLSQWQSARHVKRAPRKPKEPKPSAPPPENNDEN